jgi:hypothetical protein
MAPGSQQCKENKENLKHKAWYERMKGNNNQ